MEVYGVIYGVLDLTNGKTYIGQTRHSVKVRWGNLKSNARTGRNSQFAQAIRAHGEHNFHVFELQRADSAQELDQLEKGYIAAFQSAQNEHGYNIAEGGYHIVRLFGKDNPRSNARVTPEQNLRHAEKIKKGIAARIQRGLKAGRASERTPEELEKLKAAAIGNRWAAYPKSEEHKKKIREAQKRYWAARKQNANQHGS